MTPLELPDPAAFDAEERQAFDSVIAREQRKVASIAGPGAPFRASPLYVGLLQSPELARIVAALTSFFMLGEARGSYSNRQRELVDVVLTAELRTALVAFMHVSDAVGVGIDPDTIEAILDGAHERLGLADRMLVRYILAVARGESSEEAYAEVVGLMGPRAAAEYTAFICCKLMIMRCAQAFTSACGASALQTLWRPPSGEREDWPADLAKLREHVRALRAGTAHGHEYDRGASWISEAAES
jgi:hypothetical protein